MPPEIFPIIEKDFTAYQRFLKRKKKTHSDSIILDQQHQHHRVCCGDVGVVGGKPVGECLLNGRVSIDDRTVFSFRLFAKFFGEGPCFRFCSSGRAHTNRRQGEGLPDRTFTTPHFHHVDRHGIMRAFHNKTLADPKASAKIAKNFKLGIDLFCQELKVVSPNGGSVVVKLLPLEVDLSTDDPLRGEQFQL